MTAPDNQALFTVINIEGFSKNNPQIIDQYFATDFVEHQFGFDPPNADGVKKAMAELHAAFPDFSMTVEDLVSSPDGAIVWGRLTARGTHRGRFGPVPPTGRRFEITVVDIMHFRDGRIIEHWGVADRFALMQQLTAQPAQTPP